jgi:GDP-L-fucose synthase
VSYGDLEKSMTAPNDGESSFWHGKKVLVAGGAGFVGSHLVERLLNSGAIVRVLVRSIEKARYNLKNYLDKIEFIQGDLRRLDDCVKAVSGRHIVFNVAGDVGGISYNVSHHSPTFVSNVLMNLMLLEASRIENVEAYECTSSTCVYSREKSSNATEDEGFVDDPEPTVFGYGWAKRIAELHARLYARDYGMKVAIVRPTNAYGPRDDFRPEASHVIPALIRRVSESTDVVQVWGSGNQARSFIFVEDVARGILSVTERYACADPVNIGTEEEVTIRDLAKMIIRLSGRKLDMKFDLSKPEGQLRKFADISKAKKVMGWRPEFKLENGLKETVSWYKATQLGG